MIIKKQQIIKKNTWRMKKREIAYWWVDYSKCFINETQNKSKNFQKLSKLSANSNQLFIDYNGQELSIVRMPNSGKYKIMYSISYWNISVWFIWLLWGQSPDMLEITGQAFTIFWEQIFYFLFSYFKFTFIKWKRIDICFDLFLNINYFFNRILDEKYKPQNNIEDTEKKIKPWISAKNWLETLDIWEKNIKKNAYSFVRIYNKILDSKGKWKLFLYEDLFKKEWKRQDITRFEIEMREDLVKKFDFLYLKQYDFQFYRIVKTFYKMNIQFFKFLKDEDFIKFRKKYNAENKSIMQKIKKGLWVKTQTNSQDKAKKILEAKKLQEKYGNDFIDDADRELCVTMLRSYGGRMLRNGYTFLDIYKILKNKFDK